MCSVHVGLCDAMWLRNELNFVCVLDITDSTRQSDANEMEAKYGRRKCYGAVLGMPLFSFSMFWIDTCVCMTSIKIITDICAMQISGAKSSSTVNSTGFSVVEYERDQSRRKSQRRIAKNTLFTNCVCLSFPVWMMKRKRDASELMINTRRTESKLCHIGLKWVCVYMSDTGADFAVQSRV